MTITVLDNAIKQPEVYLKEILSDEFIDITLGDQIFKNIQPRKWDQLSEVVNKLLPEFDIVLNFVRKSPVGQVEPNFVHHDAMMGDLTVILYLNEVFPEDEGTSLYENIHTGSMWAEDENFEYKFKKTVDIKMKFNRLLIFPSRVYHSRNTVENFGEGDNSRLIQVLFLKKK